MSIIFRTVLGSTAWELIDGHLYSNFFMLIFTNNANRIFPSSDIV
jgi:hypothetical protein